MKIAYVYDAVYPYVKGGAQKRIWEIAKRLGQKHEVHLYGMKYWDGEDIIFVDRVFLHGVCRPMELYVNGRRSIMEALYFAGKVLMPLLREDFDLIDCQEAPFIPCFSSKLSSLIKNNPLVITWYEVWGDYWYEYLGVKGFFGKVIENITVRLSKNIIPISERIKEDLLKIGIANENMKVVPNGVDYQRIQNVKPSIEKTDIIYVGRLISHKNVNVLLKALSIVIDEIPEVSCCIIGDGPDMKKLKRLCKELKVSGNIKFYGFIENDDDVYSHMRASKIFVLPSIREGFPNTILEANASGLPAIVINHINNAGVGAIKNGYNGYIIDLCAEELSKKIIYLLKNIDLLCNLRKNSIEFAKEHDWDIIVSKMEKVYREII